MISCTSQGAAVTVNLDDMSLCFSYGLLVAFCYCSHVVLLANSPSVTTSKHINTWRAKQNELSSESVDQDVLYVLFRERLKV